MQKSIDDFWTQDVFLFEGTFPYYRNKPRPVRGKIHVSEEQYFDVHREIVPIANPRKGDRTYVMMHPYVLEPELFITIGLYKKPKPYADQEPVIGETIGQPKQQGVRDVQIGNAQAWYYREDKLIVLWECFLDSFVGGRHPLPENEHMKNLWRAFENWLIKQFPGATRIATPFNDPIAESMEEYQAFLRSLGYQSLAPEAKAAFGKRLK